MLTISTPAFSPSGDVERPIFIDGCDLLPATRRRHGRVPLTPGLILAWADAHRARTGSWPVPSSGPVADAPGETWRAIGSALSIGSRGLNGNDSLPRLLRRAGRIGERRGRPPMTARHSLVSRLRAEGLTLAEIGRRLGISRQATWQLLRKGQPACTVGA